MSDTVKVKAAELRTAMNIVHGEPRSPYGR